MSVNQLKGVCNWQSLLASLLTLDFGGSDGIISTAKSELPYPSISLGLVSG